MTPNGDIVFDHDVRKMIYTHILTYPGVSYITIKDIFDLPDGTLRYHLEYLEKADRILTDKENGNRCYYPLRDERINLKKIKNRLSTYNLSLNQQKILNTIKREPGITQKRLIKKTGLNRFTISYNIRKFIEMGLVKKSNSEKFVRYEYMTDELLKHEVLLRLTIKLLNKEIDEKTFFKLKDKLGIDQPEGS